MSAVASLHATGNTPEVVPILPTPNATPPPARAPHLRTVNLPTPQPVPVPSTFPAPVALPSKTSPPSTLYIVLALATVGIVVFLILS
jgi:hypothetical protein